MRHAPGGNARKVIRHEFLDPRRIFRVRIAGRLQGIRDRFATRVLGDLYPSVPARKAVELPVFGLEEKPRAVARVVAAEPVQVLALDGQRKPKIRQKAGTPGAARHDQSFGEVVIAARVEPHARRRFLPGEHRFAPAVLGARFHGPGDMRLDAAFDGKPAAIGLEDHAVAVRYAVLRVVAGFDGLDVKAVFTG